MDRARLIRIIDGKDPRLGRWPAYALYALIVFSAVVIAMETVQTLPQPFRAMLHILETGLLTLFFVEYVLRLTCEPKPLRYALSFWGIVDFLACVPALLFLVPDFQTVRLLRLLRLARLLKLFHLSRSLDRLARAYLSVRYDLAVFLFLTLVILFLAAVGIHHFEREAQPEIFGSIPLSLWWSVVTLTKVGYGDAYPITTGGRMFTGIVLLVGLGVVAVPAGLITSALLRSDIRNADEREKTP